MKIAVIIIHFGKLLTTKHCIESLYKNETHPFSIFVVNNTLDELSSVDFVNQKFTVINNKRNLGFAKGANIGIEYALRKGYDTICLLNNDTKVEKPFLKKLSFNLKKSIGIAGPAIRFKKNNKTLYDIGGKINALFLRTSHKEVNVLPRKKILPVEYVSGCCMMIRKKVFDKIGLFDENFFLYYEDVDFCLRAKEKGFATVLVPSIVINHALSQSAGRISPFTIYFLLKSGIFFGKKYEKSFLQKVTHKLFILCQALLLIKANPAATVSVARALLSY
ncbi:MAG TPA: glycosyltransferase family 2 protein [Patescibacteria group bacterium]|nr:glycosyltransferase family 2 protein [Patescibacteria group bacterium]